ncbi:hypothetical protein [Aquimarina brevivitae]|uniref:hypothetical protein n=1 Tax=Aquimarina brevivitae TaxID=323412 RepID=UPI001F5EE617|nr:hypothetical protein [Aquimarina brevivitae]
MEQSDSKKVKKYNRHNFFKDTYCVFKGAPLYKIVKRKPNYKSESGSSYYYTTKGVYRLANHWGRAATCHWRLDSDYPAEFDDLKLGFAEWEDFRENLTTEDAYYIVVDFEDKKVSYMHKDNPAYDGVAVLRTADATRKLIKQIKNLLETYKWAKYYEYEDLEEFRKEVITKLITTNITLNELRRELV